MKRKEKTKRGQNKKSHHEYPLPGDISQEQRQQNTDARQQADKDMDNDAELTAHSVNDDLDEGETARLGENKTDLV